MLSKISEARQDKDYYTIDLISDILSRGNSSRLYKELVKEKRLFSEINAFLTGNLDKGLFVISGKLVKGVEMKTAEDAIEKQLQLIKQETVGERELTKIKNKMESALSFAELDILNKAMNLAIAELLGDANLINKEMENYLSVTSAQIHKEANKIFTENNCSTLYYLCEK